MEEGKKNIVDNYEALNVCHTGGITEALSVPRDMMAPLIKRLTTCHDHVFVIDGSRHDIVTFGVSIHGRTCINEYFAG